MTSSFKKNYKYIIFLIKNEINFYILYNYKFIYLKINKIIIKETKITVIFLFSTGTQKISNIINYHDTK